jgi:hypothetical protein
MQILVDADALPRMIKEIILRASERLDIKTVFIANQPVTLPSSLLLSSIVAAAGPDEADDRIAEMAQSGDLVITQDTPLADRVIDKGATVIGPRGELLTKDNIKQRLALRDMMDQLRSGGNDEIGGGPAAFKEKDRRTFAREFDLFLTKNKHLLTIEII